MKSLSLLLCLLFIGVVASAQQDITASYTIEERLQNNPRKDAFQKAYATYPQIPAALLEALAYAATRVNNIQHEEDMDHHHGPNRVGLFGWVENGEGIFRNTLLMAAEASNWSAEWIERNEEAQVMAMAAWVNQLCVQFEVRDLSGAGIVVRSLSEIIPNNIVNRYAIELQAYEVFRTLRFGFEANGIGIAPQILCSRDWFETKTYQLVSAPQVIINGHVITDGQVFFEGDSLDLTPNNRSQDYAPALWVASPNYSSRNGTAISAVTIHTVQGSYSGCISWFQNPASQVSAHYVVRSSDGQVTQMVYESSKAWHVGNENPYTVGIEHEGYVNDAAWYTPAMYNSSSALVRDICTSNGINPTTCYNGVAHNGIYLLPATYKIKGHQHYPNQNHTDPGINWNWGSFYNLVNNVAGCAAPSGLAFANASPNSVRFSWTAVAGASSYSVQYKTAAAATWTTLNIATNSVQATNLTAGTTYNWKVAAVCNGVTGTYTTGTNFTTMASSSNACTSNLYDSGSNVANYGNNESWTYTIAPTGATSVTLTFTSFSLEQNYDFVYLYNGTSINSPLIGTYTGTNTPGTVTANSGALTLRFVSDGSTDSWGFSSSWTCTQGCAVPGTLSTSNITSNAARCNWGTVNGASSYSLQYKTAAAGTWTTVSTTNAYYNLSGLTASTAYNWRVAANCPGGASAYTATQNFTTAASCGTPSGLAASAISTSTATVAWGAVAGATNYTLDYKTTAGATWSSVVVTGTSRALTGLTASTAYQYKVRANCAGVSGAYSTTATFTTQASCWDANETNNTSATATALSSGVAKIGKICSAGDVDWFRVTTNGTSNITVTLSQLPVDYDMELYVNGVFVTGSYNGGVTNETITRTSQPANTYYYRVYGYNNVNNATLDYRILANVTAALQGGANEAIANIERMEFAPLLFELFPNPAQEQVSLRISMEEESDLLLELTNLQGQTVQTRQCAGVKGENLFHLDIAQLPTGMYMMKVQNQNGREIKPFVIAR